jgi:hypothetical protein
MKNAFVNIHLFVRVSDGELDYAQNVKNTLVFLQVIVFVYTLKELLEQVDEPIMEYKL